MACAPTTAVLVALEVFSGTWTLAARDSSTLRFSAACDLTSLLLLEEGRERFEGRRAPSCERFEAIGTATLRVKAMFERCWKEVVAQW